MFDKEDEVPRSVHLADFLVVFSSLFHNLISSFHAFSEELMELALYNANRQTRVSKVWEQFTQNLEKMEEENG